MPAITDIGKSPTHLIVVEPHVGVMLTILFISLFAVSFPGISKQIPFLRIPQIVFFIGKHFGTGVILATAFIHLLGDAFESLQNPIVKARFHNIGKWTGLIILGSLLTIFLVEYISTSYVDHLHAEPSAPPTPASSPPSSRPRSPSPRLRPSRHNSNSNPFAISILPTVPGSPNKTPDLEENVFVAVPTNPRETTPLLSRSASQPPKRTQSFNHLPVHHNHTHTFPNLASKFLPIDVLTNSPRIIKGGLVCTCICTCEDGTKVQLEIQNEGEPPQKEKPRIGRRRQIVGILVLQLGIMIHSLVIGLTLAITTGADFASLTTAIIFHQLFEGLSLGIRIAALPPAPVSSSMPSSPTSFVPAESLPRGEQLNSPWYSMRKQDINWLKLTLSVLFAITTPLGMSIGLLAFGNKTKTGKDEVAHMYLTQGLMSAISAGMLIYAATVEMIAGDFVFGDVSGGHAHGHSHESEQEVEHVAEDAEEVGRRPKREIRKKILAVLSLLAGVGGMVLVGLGE